MIYLYEKNVKNPWFKHRDNMAATFVLNSFELFTIKKKKIKKKIVMSNYWRYLKKKKKLFF